MSAILFTDAETFPLRFRLADSSFLPIMLECDPIKDGLLAQPEKGFAVPAEDRTLGNRISMASNKLAVCRRSKMVVQIFIHRGRKLPIPNKNKRQSYFTEEHLGKVKRRFGKIRTAVCLVEG
ncbi:hypothetical protein [Phyllobacterium sp. K27]